MTGARASGSPACYADGAWQGSVTIEENVQLARDTYRVRFGCPEIAGRIVPGQFIMLRLAGSSDPLLARPLALYDVVNDASGRPVGLDIVYLVVGKLTGRLAACLPGEQLEVWGPLGNGFAPQSAEHLLMVAGGIGQTPFLALAREFSGRAHFGNPPRSVRRSKRITLCYGARSAAYLAGIDDFRRLGVDVRISTDDGTAGHHGLVTELLRQVLEQDAAGCRVVCCGPEAMMHAVATLTAKLDVPCQVSLETPMACGIGICFSCVTRVRDDEGGWDYRRTCVEGPIFDARRIEF
ncbi:MAG TPA: dihydroorotate dehydrogenase electron transfer subunit [Pirellulales bacterium]|jgi:dihydroorotate dehydrogenase electron transfer subunit|nr:dihydroorotate dehydrogenase electron transfer subunit [Pirellulales bacterium]